MLSAVADRTAYANLLLPRLLTERGIAGRDAALATELTYGTLRGRATYDAVLTACSDRRLDRVDPPVREVLRMGAHQLLATRIGSHAAVATSVDLAKDVTGPRASGFVNAVLRRVATRDLGQWLTIVAPPRESDPAGYLSVRYSYPRWIVDAFGEALGDAPGGEETEAALAAGNERPSVVLAAVPGAADRAEIMPEGAEPTRWSPFGFVLPGGDPRDLVSTGRAAVQDEGSQLAALALFRAALDGPDGLWLDLCAGPGGKARLLRGLAGGRGARLVASDIHPHRAALVRAAIAPGAVVAADGTRIPWREGVFDRVLADVPCSGLGSLRRRPEARWRKSPADVAALAGLQRELLRAAIASARPGGLVAYVTCSPHVAETREVVEAVVADGGAEVLDAPALLPEVPGLRSPGPLFAQLWPHRHGTDAIFIAILRRLA